METEPRRNFEAAQNAALERSGVDAESAYFDVAALRGRAHALVCGEGPPVVMLNGIGTPAAMWAPLMAQLSGRTLYGVDLPGYGLTDPPPPGTEGLREFAVRFLADVLDELGLERPAFVANSLGSLFTLWFAMERPGRVDAVAHVGCPALAPGTSAPQPMRMLSTKLLGPLLMRLRPPSPRQVEELSKLVNQHPLPPEIAALILATERMPGFEPTFRSNLNALLRLRGARPGQALTESQLADVSQPTLLIFARDDPMGSERAGRRMAAAIPGAELRICDGGHAPWIDSAGPIANWINDFLDRFQSIGMSSTFGPLSASSSSRRST